MVTYFLNYMGPISSAFIDKYGNWWRVGRIDVHDDQPYPKEYSLDVMHKDSWEMLTEYLSDLETEEVWSKDKILDHFQRCIRAEILWFDPSEWVGP